MANRYAPYRSRYLTREPRTLVLKFTSNGTTGAQTLADKPFNMGVVNVVASATGIYKVSLGSSASSRDTYAHFAGIDFATDDTDVIVGHVSNTSCNHATDPNITFNCTHNVNADAEYVANTSTVWVRLHFLDSQD